MSKSSSESCCCRLELVFAALILRLWVGMRLFFAGLDKFRALGKYDKGAESNFGMEFLDERMSKITDGIKADTPLPGWAVDIFGAVLPWGLLGIGALVIVGLARKFALLAAGFLLLGLGLGLALLPDDTQLVGNVGVGIALTAFALVVSAYDKISLDGVIGLATGGSKKSDDA